jgi:hypothetical protein
MLTSQSSRLEIIKITEDQSIFAWASDEGRSGLFASTPSSFLHSGSIVGLSIRGPRPSPHVMTSRGLNIELDFLERASRGPGPPGFIGLLHCCRQAAKLDTCLAVYLANLRGEAPDVFNRVECNRLLSIELPQSPTRKTVYIRQEHSTEAMQQSLPISIRTRSIQCEIPLMDRHPHHGLYWRDEQCGPKLLQLFAGGVSTTVSSLGNVAYLIFREFEVPFVLVIGIFQDCPPLIDIREPKGTKSLDDVAQGALQEKTFELNKFRSRFVTDRPSLCLGSSGKLLKAVMKKQLVAGKAEYVLDLDIVVT